MSKGKAEPQIWDNKKLTVKVKELEARIKRLER
jgi:hypothetical protein